MVRHHLGNFEAHSEALQPRCKRRRRSCSDQPETPDAMSSDELAFDPITKARSVLAWEDNASFARWCAPCRFPL